MQFQNSCSSAMSGVSDRRLDELLGDGVKNQSISDNQVSTYLILVHNSQVYDEFSQQ